MKSSSTLSGRNPRLLIFSALMAALTAIGAYIMIPLPISPVPVTLQNLFVVLSGMLLGAKAGFLSQIIYLALGLIGLPVFAGGTAGVGVLFSPTGGYLMAFPLAAYVIGKISGGNIKIDAVSASIGMILIYVLGASFMVALWDFTPVQALSAGVFPFLPGDIFKVVVAIAITVSMPRSLINRLEMTAG